MHEMNREFEVKPPPLAAVPTRRMIRRDLAIVTNRKTGLALQALVRR